MIDDPERAAKDPELAVLSAMAHGQDDFETAVKVGFAAQAATAHITDRDRYVLYNDLILDALSAAARKALEMLPEGYQFKTSLIRESIEKGLAQGEAKGRVEGQREVLSRLLMRRFGPLPDWATSRVAEASVDQLESYLDAVLNASSLAEALQLHA